MSDLTNLAGDKTSTELDRLQTAEADREQAEEAIKRAMAKRGMSREMAHKLYGVPQ